MGVIKASVAPTTAAVFSMRDVEAEARAIVEAARRQAEQIVKAAQAEGERIRAERFRQGFAEGKAAGYAKGREEGLKSGHDEAFAAHGEKLRNLVSALADASQKLEASRKQLETETVLDVVRLAVAIGRRVTHRLAEVEPEVAKANVAEALRMVINASAVKVALHPSQLAVLEQELPAIRAMFPRLQQVELVADDSLSPGGCRLLVGSGMVDADLDTQLDRVVADLLPPGMEAPR